MKTSFLERIKAEGPIRCAECGEGQLSRKLLAVHLRTEHHILPDPSVRPAVKRLKKGARRLGRPSIGKNDV